MAVAAVIPVTVTGVAVGGGAVAEFPASRSVPNS